jgi:hypothetical protein
MGWMSRVQVPAGAMIGIFSHCHHIQTGLGPTQPPIQRVLGALTLAVKQVGHEADHSPPCSAEVKNALNYTSTPPIRLHGTVLS